LEAAGDGVKATEVYNTKDKLNSIGGTVRVGDFVYGTTGDQSRAKLVCLEFKTGKEKWKSDCVEAASVCYADGCLYVRGFNGPVALVEATPDGYKEKGRFDQPERSTEMAWPHPVIANGCLYLRDQGVLLCYDVKAR